MIQIKVNRSTSLEEKNNCLQISPSVKYMSIQYSVIDKQSLEEGGNEKLPEQSTINKIFGIIGAGILIGLCVIIIIILFVIFIAVCVIVLAFILAVIDYYAVCRDAGNCFAYFWHLIFVIKLDIPPGQFITSLVRMMMLIVGSLIFLLELCVCLVVTIIVIFALCCCMHGFGRVIMHYTDCIGQKVKSMQKEKSEDTQ